jgi:predicted PurR-regulated permease PerM
MQDGYSRVSIPEGIRQVTDGTIISVEQFSIGIVRGIVQALISLVGQSFNIILAPFVSYYFLRDFDRIGAFAVKTIPVRYRAEFIQVGKDIDQVLRRFIKGSLWVAFLVGIITTVGMYFIGMDFPLLIGIMVGITNIIPYFGAIISTIPAVLLALGKSKWLAIYVLGLMLIIQQIEGNIISPKILGSSVGLHPLIIIFALLAAGYLWGIAGLLFAVPLAAVLKVIFQHMYLRLI